MTDRLTDRQSDYCNPLRACALRVNNPCKQGEKPEQAEVLQLKKRTEKISTLECKWQWLPSWLLAINQSVAESTLPAQGGNFHLKVGGAKSSGNAGDPMLGVAVSGDNGCLLSLRPHIYNII